MKKIIYVLTMLVFPAMLYANSSVPNNRTITKFVTYDGLVVIKFSPAVTTNPENCSGGANVYEYGVIDLTPTGSKLEAMVSNGLSAFIAGKSTVGFGMNGCYTGWGGGVPKIYRLEAE